MLVKEQMLKIQNSADTMSGSHKQPPRSLFGKAHFTGNGENFFKAIPHEQTAQESMYGAPDFADIVQREQKTLTSVKKIQKVSADESHSN